MPRNYTLADGQVAASATAILSGTSIPENGGKVQVVFQNTAVTSETVVVTQKVSGGTARRVARAVLATNEQLIISGFPIQPDDTLLAATTNASAVDYVVSISEGPLQIYTLDSNGAIKNGASAIGSGNQQISGDLIVAGGDIDAGASGTAGTVDVFPTTAAKGKVSITAADSAGDTTTTIVNASQSGARTYTIPDAGASASFAMTEGAQTINGAKTFGTMPIIPSATVAATGSAQGDAAAITTGFTLVTAADATKGVKLPAAAAGLVAIVKNGDAANAVLKVYPNTSDAINALAGDAAISMAAKTAAMFVAYDATTWYTIPLLPS